MSARVPQSVLSDHLDAAIAGRRVRAAVFTTYTFDPGFFELEILPVLFAQSFHANEKLRQIQLEEPLRACDVAVYYDLSALTSEASPARLDWQRIGVTRGRSSGVFHPKLVMVLVDEPLPDDADEGVEPYQALIVGTLSANLTRSGWWENVEVGHVEEIKDKDLAEERCPFVSDLRDILRRVKRTSRETDHDALDQVDRFLRRRVVPWKPSLVGYGGRHYTRVFTGQGSLTDWLADMHLEVGSNLEIISPYFDGDRPTALIDLIETLEPKEVRVYLPVKPDGSAAVTRKQYEEIEAVASWSKLPDGIVESGSSARAADAAPRNVHAKLYRIWHKRKQVALIGSVNLTSAGHSHGNAGNQEAAFFVDLTDSDVGNQWILEPLAEDERPEHFTERTPSEEAPDRDAYIDLAVSYDWAEHQLCYRLGELVEGAIELRSSAGAVIAVFEAGESDEWHELSEESADRVRDLLRASSLLAVEHAGGTCTVLVRETGMSHKPSLVAELTAEEILLYWSLLSPAQREAVLIEKLIEKGELNQEGIPIKRGDRAFSTDGVFERFAGVYHAFERLREHVFECLERGEGRDAEARLFGAKFDSLPELLRKTWEKSTDDVVRYVIFLCAQQVARDVRREFPDFWKASASGHEALTAQLGRLPELREALPIEREDREAFLEWYERQFLNRIDQPVTDE